MAVRSGELRTRPQCAVCDKPVDKVVEEQDAFRGRLVLTAYCHGATQRVVLEEHETVDTLGPAFLPECPPRLPG